MTSREIRHRLRELRNEARYDSEPPRSLQGELARQDRIARRAARIRELEAELARLRTQRSVGARKEGV